MTKLKYVGLKQDGETAFSAETQITWFPDTVEDVAAPIAARMLNHPDVFALADDEKAKLVAELKKSVSPELPTHTVILPDGMVLVLDDLDKVALHELAKAHDVEVHHNAGADKVIAALVTAFAVK